MSNYTHSPAIKKHFAKHEMYVKVKSVWSGRLSNAISVEPAVKGEKHSVFPHSEWMKIIPILEMYVEEHDLDAIVYANGCGSQIIEYR